MEAVEKGGKTAVVLGQKLEEGTYRTIKERGLGGTGEEGTVMSYQMPVRTTPLAYVPQPWALPWQGCWDWAVLGLLFMGRLFNLMFLLPWDVSPYEGCPLARRWQQERPCFP